MVSWMDGQLDGWMDGWSNERVKLAHGKHPDDNCISCKWAVKVQRSSIEEAEKREAAC